MRNGSCITGTQSKFNYIIVHGIKIYGTTKITLIAKQLKIIEILQLRNLKIYIRINFVNFNMF